MSGLGEPVRTRFLPALVTAIGVTLLAAGILSIGGPVAAGPATSPSPTPSTSTATAAPVTLPPITSAAPSAGTSFPPDRVATRVRIAALRIDLPVILQVTRDVPCDVAMYFDDARLGQPGEGRATYLYAHAQSGMFLPLLEASRVRNGKRLLGMVVEVWTSDDRHFLYEIDRVIRHVPFDTGLARPMAATSEELWLQTSEGVGEAPKLQVVARLLSEAAALGDEARPTPRPRVCG